MLRVHGTDMVAVKSSGCLCCNFFLYMKIKHQAADQIQCIATCIYDAEQAHQKVACCAVDQDVKAPQPVACFLQPALTVQALPHISLRYSHTSHLLNMQQGHSTDITELLGWTGMAQTAGMLLML